MRRSNISASSSTDIKFKRVHANSIASGTPSRR